MGKIGIYSVGWKVWQERQRATPSLMHNVYSECELVLEHCTYGAKQDGCRCCNSTDGESDHHGTLFAFVIVDWNLLNQPYQIFCVTHADMNLMAKALKLSKVKQEFFYWIFCSYICMSWTLKFAKRFTPFLVEMGQAANSGLPGLEAENGKAFCLQAGQLICPQTKYTYALLGISGELVPLAKNAWIRASTFQLWLQRGKTNGLEMQISFNRHSELSVITG